MPDWLVETPQGMIWVAVSSIGIYAALIVFARLAGLRSFSKISGFDFAVTVAFGSLIGSTVVAEDPPLAQGIAALGCLFAIQMVMARLRLRYEWAEGLSTNTPRLIMIGPEIQHDQLEKARLTHGDLLSKLRDANALCFEQVIAVIAETTGEVTVLHDADPSRRAAFDPALLHGIIGAERFRKSRPVPLTDVHRPDLGH